MTEFGGTAATVLDALVAGLAVIEEAALLSPLEAMEEPEAGAAYGYFLEPLYPKSPTVLKAGVFCL